MNNRGWRWAWSPGACWRRERIITDLLVAVLVLSILAVPSVCASSEEYDTEEHEVGAIPAAPELEPVLVTEYPRSPTLELTESRSRMFQSEHRIARTFVSDPGIAVPVVVNDNQILILGLIPGTTTIALWDEMGGVMVVDVCVREDRGELVNSLLDLGRLLAHRILLKKESRKFARVGEHPFPVVEIEPTRGPYMAVQWHEPGEKDNRPATADVGDGEGVVDRERRAEVDAGSSPPERTAGTRALPVPRKAAIDGSTADRVIEVAVSQARIFRMASPITELISSDSSTPDPAIFSEHEFAVEGKAEGVSFIRLKDAKGRSETFKLQVVDTDRRSGARNTERQAIPVERTPAVRLSEHKISAIVNLKKNQVRGFRVEAPIVKVVICESAVGEPIVVSSSELIFQGCDYGCTHIFLWDRAGRFVGVELRVAGRTKEPKIKTPEQTRKEANALLARVNSGEIDLIEVRRWYGKEEDTFKVPDYRVEEVSSDPTDVFAHPPLALASLGPAPDRPRHRADTVIMLNNEGVRALNTRQFARAIRLFDEAFMIDPSYPKARVNMAIAYNNWALSFGKDLRKGVRLVHASLFLDPDLMTSNRNFESIIQLLGYSKHSFKDRVTLAERALSEGDLAGAYVEYKAALAIEDDRAIESKLEHVVAALKLREKSLARERRDSKVITW